MSENLKVYWPLEVFVCLVVSFIHNFADFSIGEFEVFRWKAHFYIRDKKQMLNIYVHINIYTHILHQQYMLCKLIFSMQHN
jgi:hypothetical protein